jgi:hypothetical protein
MNKLFTSLIGAAILPLPFAGQAQANTVPFVGVGSCAAANSR